MEKFLLMFETKDESELFFKEWKDKTFHLTTEPIEAQVFIFDTGPEIMAGLVNNVLPPGESWKYKIVPADKPREKIDWSKVPEPKKIKR